MDQREKLDFSSGINRLVDLSFYVSIPEGFHACQDQAIIGAAREIVVVPEEYSFFDNAMEAEFALSVQTNPSDIPLPMSQETKDLYIRFFQQNTSLFEEDRDVFSVRIRQGAGVLYQLVGDPEDNSWIKVLGLLFVQKKCYLIHLIWNHHRPEGNSDAVVAEFQCMAEDWMARLYLSGEETEPRFRNITPREDLFPHYEHIRKASIGIPGVKMVVNSSGTEYEFIPLKNENSQVSTRIAALPLEPFPLADIAWEMASVFRVDKSVFDPKHDRECQLKNRYMHRAYMMSALRSFFWTVDAYCEDNSVTPGLLTDADVDAIVEHIAERQWLNYTDDAHGSTLCDGQDYHVYYVPNKTSAGDIEALKPTLEDYQRVQKIQSSFSSYFEILPEVRALEDLRDDLEYIYPAILLLYNELARTRDPYEQLTGNKADILYAWCALAIAAKEPFFSEDGPMNCWFTQMTGPLYVAGTVESKYIGSTKCSATTTTKPKGKIVPENDCRIDTGVFEKYYGSEKEIVLPDGINAIGEDAFLFNKTLESVVIPEGVETIENDAFWGCEALVQVELPESLKTIGKSAFRGCSSLKMIVIPGGVNAIGDDAFTSCKALRDGF